MRDILLSPMLIANLTYIRILGFLPRVYFYERRRDVNSFSDDDAKSHRETASEKYRLVVVVVRFLFFFSAAGEEEANRGGDRRIHD